MLLPQFNRLPDAIAHAREAVRLAPDLPDAFIVLGDLLMNAGHSGEATGVYGEALPKTRQTLACAIATAPRCWSTIGHRRRFAAA